MKGKKPKRELWSAVIKCKCVFCDHKWERTLDDRRYKKILCPKCGKIPGCFRL